MHETIQLHYKTEDQTLLGREYSCIFFYGNDAHKAFPAIYYFLNLANFWGNYFLPKNSVLFKINGTENLGVEEDTKKT